MSAKVQFTAIIALMVFSSIAYAQERTVPSGARVRIGQHWALDRQCASERITAKVTVPPQHGTLSVVQEKIIVPPTNGRGETERCVGRNTQAAVVYYKSANKFTGTDEFTYERFNLDRPGSKANGSHHVTVTVR